MGPHWYAASLALADNQPPSGGGIGIGASILHSSWLNDARQFIEAEEILEREEAERAATAIAADAKFYRICRIVFWVLNAAWTLFCLLMQRQVSRLTILLHVSMPIPMCMFICCRHHH